jgi:hypothetical protein
MSRPGAAIAERLPPRALVLLGLLVCAAGCGSRVVTLPDDDGTPLPDFAEIHQQATRVCRGVRTLRGQIGLGGSAGDQRLRGRLLAGFERPDSMRLEYIVLGRAGFLLAARGGEGMLVLPRDNAILRDVPPEDILGELTGVNLAPADILAVLTGCVVPEPMPTAGRLHGNGWAAVDHGGGAVAVRPRGGAEWQARAARRDGWRVDYVEWEGLFPRVVQLQSQAADRPVDMTATLSEISSNTDDIGPAAFTLVEPPGARSISLGDLRAASPLGDQE